MQNTTGGAHRVRCGDAVGAAAAEVGATGLGVGGFHNPLFPPEKNKKYMVSD